MIEDVDPAEAIRGLFLIVPPGFEADQALVPLLATGTVVGVLFETGADEGSSMLEACRSAGVAAFTREPDEAQRLAADGVLLQGAEVARARLDLGADRLIGARVGVSRHQAMVAGEEGADFIAFGDLDHPMDERLIELVGWWSELFVLPSLALAGAPDEAAARRLGAAGADFLGVPLGRPGTEPAALVRLAEAFGGAQLG